MANSSNKKKILIFGAGGFIGSKIVSYFASFYDIKTLKIDEDFNVIKKFVDNSDIIIHAAGVSRSDNENDFFKVNIEFSTLLSTLLAEHKNKIVIYFSSIHFNRDDIYGFSKRYNEYLFSKLGFNGVSSYTCIRTPGVFGPDSRPNYVSVVSTFCYNFANNLSSIVNDPDKNIDLIYIGDILEIINSLLLRPFSVGYSVIEPKSVKISVGKLYSLIDSISLDKNNESNENENIEFINQIKLTYKHYKNHAKPKYFSK